MSDKIKQVPIKSEFDYRATAEKVVRGKNLKGKIAIVTGGYSGVGLEAVRALAKAGAKVYVPARNLEKAKEAVAGIPNIVVELLDLMDQKSIDVFADRFLSSGSPLHILINSAGIMAPPLKRDKRGYESQFATNHLGHFQLTARLWPALKKAGNARVITVSSRAQRIGGINFDDPNFEKTEYDPWKAYAQSKSANVLFTVELDRLAKDYGVRAFAVHPGLVPTTGIGRHVGTTKRGMIGEIILSAVNKLNLIKLQNITQKDTYNKFKTIKQGAATSVWCATSEDLNGIGGVYCEDCNIAVEVSGETLESHGVCPWAVNPEYAKRLWNLSEDMTGVKFEF